MTKLNERKTRLVFETADCYRERGKLRQVVIEANPLTATIRLKGTRTKFDLPWSAFYALAAKAAAEQVRREKKNRKRGQA